MAPVLSHFCGGEDRSRSSRKRDTECGTDGIERLDEDFVGLLLVVDLESRIETDELHRMEVPYL